MTTLLLTLYCSWSQDSDWYSSSPSLLPILDYLHSQPAPPLVKKAYLVDSEHQPWGIWVPVYHILLRLQMLHLSVCCQNRAGDYKRHPRGSPKCQTYSSLPSFYNKSILHLIIRVSYSCQDSYSFPCLLVSWHKVAKEIGQLPSLWA